MIKPITQDDIIELSKLYSSVFSEPPWNEVWETSWAQKRLEIIFNSPNFEGFLYEENGKSIGAVFGRGNSFKGNKELEIVELFVSSDKQSKGIGSKLIEEVENSIKSRGYKGTVLLTARCAPAYKFYCNKGYKSAEDMRVFKTLYREF